MLKIVVGGGEFYDRQKEEFIIVSPRTLTLEHSLLSISKWEAKWCKPFLSSDKTSEELLDYVRCMTISQGVEPEVYRRLSQKNMEDIIEYINSPMTATTINERNKKRNRDVVTSELIYFWMIDNGVPMECEKWHLNRLMTLIRVCNIKNSPGKKMKKKDIAQQYASLNKARRAKSGSKG